MKRLLLAAGFAIALVPSPAQAQQCVAYEGAALIDSFSDHASQSSAAYDYPGYEVLLNTVVWEKPRSARVHAAQAKPGRFEANHIFFHMLTGADRAAVYRLLKTMQRKPENVPLAALERSEQLAYWLNLHNLAMLELVARSYQAPALDRVLEEAAQEKTLCVENIALSLNDIRHVLLPALSADARVPYGLYMGAVDGPNIRRQPYRGATLYPMLEENAREFVNAARGVRFVGTNALVSEFYAWHAAYFPSDFALKAHLKRYAEGEVARRLPSAARIDYADFDWFVADALHNNPPQQVVGAENVQDAPLGVRTGNAVVAGRETSVKVVSSGDKRD